LFLGGSQNEGKVTGGKNKRAKKHEPAEKPASGRNKMVTRWISPPQKTRTTRSKKSEAEKKLGRDKQVRKEKAERSASQRADLKKVAGPPLELRGLGKYGKFISKWDCPTGETPGGALQGRD